MRVLVFTSLFPNREKPLQGIFVFQRMVHFAERSGNQVQVVAPVPYFPRWIHVTSWASEGKIPHAEEIGPLTVYHPRYPFLPKISMPLHGVLMFLGCFLTVHRVHKQTPFDCIDAHFVYPDGFAAILFGKLLNLPVIVSARGTDINLYPTFRLIRPLIRWTLKHADGLIAVSKTLQEAMVSLGAQPERTCVIGNGIDGKRFYPVDSSKAKRQLGLLDSDSVIVSVGALIPRKGFHLLIQAFAQIVPRFGNLRLYILGEGEYRSALEALISDHELKERVILVGSVPNQKLRLWFSAAAVSCLASSREGWANVLQESMACGTPVVATRVWGSPEVVVSSELGILVEPEASAIGAALEVALTKRWNRALIAEHAAQRTWKVVAVEVEDFLSSVISHAGGFGALPPPRC